PRNDSPNTYPAGPGKALAGPKWAEKRCFNQSFRLWWARDRTVNLNALSQSHWFRPALGASLVAICGLLLWKTSVGEPWVDASYDYMFRFGSQRVTNSVVLIMMDNEAYQHFGQDREHPWDRALHARLLDKLTDDGASLVVFDCIFRAPQSQDPNADE